MRGSSGGFTLRQCIAGFISAPSIEGGVPFLVGTLGDILK